MTKPSQATGGAARNKRHTTSDAEWTKVLQQAMDAVITHGGVSQAAKAIGVARITLHDRNEKAIEAGLHPSPAALKAAGLKPPKPSPFSEDETKFRAEFTPQDCIDELMRLVEANPDQVISRNFFRVYSRISESTWNRFFGTFHEFKRQAGVVLSRHQHRLERQIAKHASVDVQRDMNIEKRSFEGKWRKPSNRRFQTVLVGSDIHDKDCDPFWERTFVDTAARVQPDKIVLNGDVFDLPEFSKHTQDPRDWDLVGRIRWVHGFLAQLRKACPEAEFLLVEGNHEFRLMRHLAEATPAMKVLLADLHGMTVGRLLGLDRYEVNLVARADLTAWTERDIKKELQNNWVCLYDAVIGHHFPEGRHMGYPGWNGHHHKHIVWPGYNPTHGAYEWHQLGSGHRRDASYCNGEKWANGFLLAHVDTQTRHTQFDYVQLGDHVVIGGKWYTRRKSEEVSAVLPNIGMQSF